MDESDSLEILQNLQSNLLESDKGSTTQRTRKSLTKPLNEKCKDSNVPNTHIPKQPKYDCNNM